MDKNKWIEEKVKEFHRICTPYFGAVSDEKESIDVFFEPSKFQGELRSFLRQSLEEAFDYGYDVGIKDGAILQQELDKELSVQSK